MLVSNKGKVIIQYIAYVANTPANPWTTRMIFHFFEDRSFENKISNVSTIGKKTNTKATALSQFPSKRPENSSAIVEEQLGVKPKKCES